MRGEFVLVRAFGGKALKRRVWDVGVGVVYITSDEQFQNLISGKRAVTPIGFPAEDVFRDLEFLRPDDDSIDWSKLIPWQAGATCERFPLGCQENFWDLGGRPKQYPLCFEGTTCEQVNSPVATQIPMFPGLAATDENIHAMNSKRAFNENKRRLFGRSTAGY